MQDRCLANDCAACDECFAPKPSDNGRGTGPVGPQCLPYCHEERPAKEGGGHDYVGVFLPCAPNPTTGFFFYVPKSKLIEVDTD